MSEYFPVEFHIGGPIKRSLLPELVAICCTDDLFLSWDDTDSLNVDKVIQRIEEDHELILLGKVNWGDTPELNEFCVKNQLPFTKNTASVYEYGSDIAWWHPGMSDVESWSPADPDGKFAHMALRQLRKEHTAGKTLQDVIQQLERVAPELPATSVVD